MDNVVNKFVEDLVTNWGATLATLAAVGGLSSAIVDAVKTAFRRRFHKHRIEKFFMSLPPASLARATFGESSFPPQFYSLKREDMISILSGGLNTALDFPGHYVGAIKPALGSIDSSMEKLVTDLEALPDDDLNSQTHFDLRTKLKRMIDNRLETFNKMTEIRWVSYIYFATLLVSFLIIVSATLFANFNNTPLGSTEHIIFYWLFGALLAPVAHDLSTALIAASKR